MSGKFVLLVALVTAIPSVAFSQARTITGTVTEASSGQPLYGVTVAILGTSSSTITGIDGTYEVRAVTGDAVTFSFVGYVTQTVRVSESDILNVALIEVAELLEEVVVVGYGTQRRATVTGSAQRVVVDEANVGLVNSPEQLIQGRVAGLNVIQSGGEPGAPVTVRIRGGTSISASNEPLYVLDGVPIDNGNSAPVGLRGSDSGRKNPLVFLSPGDIETIDVLKDASAAAIYGSRGANGVILITTKQGPEGQIQVDYDAFVSSSQFIRDLPLLDAAQYRNFVEKSGLPTTNLGNADTDWQDEVTRNAVSHNHNLAFGGSTRTTQYRASVSYLNQEGIIINSGLERVSSRVNVNHLALDNRLRLDMRITGSFFNDNRAPFQQTGGFAGGVLTNVLKYNPTLPVYNDDGSYYEIAGQTSVRNPVALANQVDDFTKTTRVLGGLKADYEVIQGLTGTINVGLDRQQASRRVFIPGTNPLRQVVGGEAKQGNSELTSVLGEAYATYSRLFNGAHNVSGIAGYSFQEFYREGFSASTTGFVSDVFSYNNLGAGDLETFSVASYKEINRLIALFGRFNYDYEDRYIVGASIRRDGSSRFGMDSKWGLFPAVTLGWRLSNEPILQRVRAINDLKLRIGWGVTGSQEIGNLRSLAIFGSSGSAVIGERVISGVAPTNFANPQLKWEETRQLNVGVDFGLWNDRFYGALDYYVKDTQDLLLEFEVPQPSAVPTRLVNAGRVQNRGIEAVFSARFVDTGKLVVDIGATFNMNDNEIKDLGGRTQIFTGRSSGAGLSQVNTQIITPGEALGSFFAPLFVGFDHATGRQLCQNAAGADVPCSNVPISEYRIVGAAQPDFQYGFTANATWKNFDVSVFLRGEQGRDIYNNTGLVYTSKNLANTNVNFLEEALNDPTPLAEAPQYSSRWIQDASFLRVENFTVGYTLSNVTALSRVVGTIRRARIYVAANNLFVFTSYSGWDPEVNTEASASTGNISILSLGIDYTNYPRPRTVTAGISLGF